MDKYAITRHALENNALTIEQRVNVFEQARLTRNQTYTLLTEILERRKSIVELAKNYNLFKGVYFRTLLMLQNYRFKHELISNDDFDKVYKFLRHNKKQRTQVLSRLIFLLKDINQIEILTYSGFITNKRSKFNILRRVLELGEFDLYSRVSKELEIDMLSRNKLEILHAYYSRKVSISEIEDMFRKVKEPYFLDYFSNVDSFWNYLEDHRNFLEMRRCADKRAEFTSAIERALKNKESFSFVRLSDGEAYAYSDDDKLSERQENHWWGETLAKDLREKIKSDFQRYMMTEAFDFIGVPSTYKYVHYIGFTNVVFDCQTDLDRKVINRIGFVINTLSPMIKEGCFREAKICEDQINNEMFDLNYFVKLTKSAGRLIIISGYDSFVLSELTSEINIPKIFISIPTHNLLKMRGDTNSYGPSLPYVYDSILSEIDSTVMAGDLCLISGGFIGKMFVAACQKKNGVAIDIGQVLGRVINNAK